LNGHKDVYVSKQGSVSLLIGFAREKVSLPPDEKDLIESEKTGFYVIDTGCHTTNPNLNAK
jgi:hypothetical protein